MGQRRLRRLGAAIAALAVTAGVAVALGAGPGDETPAPVVWRDYVVEPTTTTVP